MQAGERLSGILADSDEASEDSSLTDSDWDEDVQLKADTGVDTTGRQVYLKKCEELKIVPASQLVERIEEDYIDLNHYGLGDKGSRAVAECIRVNRTMRGMNLGDNTMGDDGGLAVAQALAENPTLTQVDLSENRLGSRFAWGLGEVLASKSCALVDLTLRGNKLGDREMGMIASALVNNGVLLRLDISYNELGERGGEALGEMLGGNQALTDLDVSWNNIVRRGAIALANALKTNSAVTRFRMGWNSLGDPGAAVLGEALQVNQSLKLLDISHNRIGAEGMKMIAAGLALNRTLLVFHAQHNIMKDAGSRPLAEAIYGVTSCLTDVDFRSCEMPPEIEKEVMITVLERRRLYLTALEAEQAARDEFERKREATEREAARARDS